MKRLQAFVIACLPLALSGCMTPLDREPITTPVKVDGVVGFEWLARDGKFYYASAATAEGITLMADQGLNSVINLMTEDEVLALDYNEPGLVRALGLQYFSLPITIEKFSVNDVRRFTEILRTNRYETMIQSPSADRVGMLWGAYLIRERGFDLVNAEIRARAAGLSSAEAAEAMRRVAMEGREAK